MLWYQDTLYTVYELKFQSDQTQFQDSNFKKTLWVFQHLQVLLLVYSDECALITLSIAAKKRAKKYLLQGNRISGRSLTCFHLPKANLTLLHMLWRGAHLTCSEKALLCQVFSKMIYLSCLTVLSIQVFVMSTMNLPCCKSSALLLVLSHRQGKNLLPVPLHTLLHISGVLLRFPSFFHALKKASSFSCDSEFVFSSPLITLYIALSYVQVFVLVLPTSGWCLLSQHYQKATCL